MDDNNLKQLWSSASKIIEEKNKLSESDILASLAHKSNNVIDKFKREKQLGLIMVWFLPILGIIEIINSGLSAFSIGFTLLLLSVTVWAVSLVKKQLSHLDSFNEGESIKQTLESKIIILKSYFTYGRTIAPIIGLVLMDASIILINLIDNGKLPTEISFWGFTGILSIGYWYLIRFISYKQEEKYITPLQNCLDAMNEKALQHDFKAPKSSTTLLVFILLIIALVLNIIFYFLK